MAERVVPESVLFIPVPEATPLVHHHRLRYDPAAPAHVPEHITLMYPFLAPDAIDGAVLSTLQATLSAVSPFTYTLQRTAWFEQGVLYLAPEPAAPFVALTQWLNQLFNILPFGGRYWPKVIPHLTIAQYGPKDVLIEIATTLSPQLPIAAVAREAWLMTGHNETGFVLHERFTFDAPRHSCHPGHGMTAARKGGC